MVLNIDWLQIHLRGSINRESSYTFKKLPFATQVFNVVEDVYQDSEYIASICSEPRSPVLNQFTVIVKIINRILYSPTLFTTVDNLLSSLGCKYMGLTRLDVCADFNTFKNGLHPETFINRFMTMKFRKLGHTKGTCHFEQKTIMRYQTLKFGTGTSQVASYLYNKSKELQDMKMKPYIVDMWQASGLDVTKDIWRLEFAIKGNALSLQLEELEEPEKVSYESLKSGEFLTRLYYSLQYAYFRFKLEAADKNISRWKDVEILPSRPLDAKRIFITETGDATRADKIFLKKLDKMNDEIRNYANYREDFMNELMCEVAVNKGLSDYYLDKISGKATASIKYLKAEQMSAYENLQRHAEDKKQAKNLFSQDEKYSQLAHVILRTKGHYKK